VLDIDEAGLLSCSRVSRRYSISVALIGSTKPPAFLRNEPGRSVAAFDHLDVDAQHRTGSVRDRGEGVLRLYVDGKG